MIVTADPQLVTIVAGIVQRNESIAYEWLVNCGRRDAAERVVHLLLETALRSHVDAETEPLTLPFTQAQIAQITGQTSVNVNRVFADLVRNGLIERRGREIRFTNVRKLQSMCEFDATYLRFPWK
jgi:CRP-like cAMP-binding protein